jgi:hypothetical protein
MSEHEGRDARAVYDHEVEDPRLAGRRRAVADWGVGEEIFDHLPRRRFRQNESQRRDHHRSERRAGRVEAAGEDRRAERVAAVADEPPRWRVEPRVEPVAAIEPSVEHAPDELAEAPIPPIDAAAPLPEGRRTVVIRGRGAEAAWTPRSRPPRTVGERIGPRPDRLAAWAVALGMLLILIAVLTAHG